jgi:2,4-dienoyl-CoA reductase-like NADH-dependent reductase (Old Yellow Enzyme family)
LAKVEGWAVPKALSLAEIADIIEAYRQGARRCREAGFEALNIHAAHGYLIHSFYSPLSNLRRDAYGGSREGRMRLALDIAEAVRREWPRDRPLFFRLSCVDGAEGGWTIEDTVALSAELGRRGVDIIDCSSGGIGASPTAATWKRRPGFQVPYAEQVRRETGLPTMAVGLILKPRQAESILAEARADLVAIAREALFNPHWPLHAALELGADPDWSLWPPNYGWWLHRRTKTLDENS